jgi:branched-chain amino acid transport system permease protein
VKGPEAATPSAGTAPVTAGAVVAGSARRRRRGTVVYAAAFLVAAAVVLVQSSPLAQYQATLIVIFAVLALSQEWLIGRSGQVSLAAGAMLMLGAFVTARVAQYSFAPFPVPLIASGVFGAVAGLVVGLPALRFKGIYLVLITLAFQYILSFAAQEYQGNNGVGLTVPVPALFGYSFGPGRPFLFLAIAVLGLTMLFLHGIYERGPGRIWSALRQSPTAATVIGINLVKWRIFAFVGSSALAAVAGSLYSYNAGTVSYDTFTLDLAISVIVMVYIGGAGSMLGSLIGATVITLLPYFLQRLGDAFSNVGNLSSYLTTNGSTIADLIYGLALTGVLLYEPGGIVGFGRRLAAWAWSHAPPRRPHEARSTSE